MTVVREPIWDDAPRSRIRGVICRLTELLATLGWSVRLFGGSVAAFPQVLSRRNGRRNLLQQLYAAGIRTLPVITVVALFTGMILALQVGLALRQFNQEFHLGSAVMISLLREMGPFCCGMCLAACAGSSIAAELGTMKVNDELAALEIMAIPPVRYLAAPRLLALTLMAPLLGFYSCAIGALGGGLVGVTQLGVDFSQYMDGAITVCDMKDLATGLLKALIFGMTVGGVSCACGFAAEGGATGVGKATQRGVIFDFLLILMLGYIVTRIAYR